MISRLRSSAHCRSQNESIVGPGSEPRIRSTISRARPRRRTCSAASVVVAQVEQLAAELGKRAVRVIVRARSRIDDAGTLRSCGATAPSAATHARDPRPCAERRQEPGLADPGLAGEQQELATTGDDVVEAAVRELEQVVAPDEERTSNGSERGKHRLRSVCNGRRRSSVDRPMTRFGRRPR